MIKTILAPATGSDRDAATFAAALAICRQFDAHLDVLHVRPDATGTALAMTTDGGSGALTAHLIEQLEAESNDRAAKAEGAFDEFCAAAELTIADVPPAAGSSAASAAWHVEIGDTPRWMATYGQTADLIVAPRVAGDDVGARAVLEAVLLDAGRPLLIPAGTGLGALPREFERVAIAWKPTPQAARAVGLAMPFLARAKEIVVLLVAELADERADRAEPLLRYLAWHGLRAGSQRLDPGPDGAVALLTAAAAHADLLVMGGYGHSRMREWVFGGFTQKVLANAPLPVLIAH